MCVSTARFGMPYLRSTGDLEVCSLTKATGTNAPLTLVPSQLLYISIGLDGAVLVEVMKDRGVSTSKMEGHVQRIRRGDGATGADPVYPRLLDFWQVARRFFGFDVSTWACGYAQDGHVIEIPTPQNVPFLF